MRPWVLPILAACLFCAVVSCGESDRSSANAAGDGGESTDGEVDAVVADACLNTGSFDRVWLAIDELPETMLGLKPVTYQGKSSTFHWAVPPSDWTVEVHVVHDGTWCPTALPKLTWQQADGGGVGPLGDAAPAGAWHLEPGGHVWQARVVEALPGGVGMFSLRASVDDSDSPDLSVQVAERTANIDPFDEVDPWAITFERDRGTLQVLYKDGVFDVTTTGVGQPNGITDFEEALAALGLMGGNGAFNAKVVAYIKAEMLRKMREIYHLDVKTGAIGPDGVRIRLVFEGDPALPDRSQRGAKGWSQIVVGGEDSKWKPGGKTFFGRAQVDYRNQKANNNTKNDLGVFTTAFVRFVLGHPAGALLLDGYTPASGGKPLGSVDGDDALLDGTLDPDRMADGPQRSRVMQVRLVLRLLSLALAAVTAHEIGHSLGLVRKGLPPTGMLSMVKGPWVTSMVGDGHVDTPGYNLMQTGSSFSFSDLTGPPPRFNAANLGYLRRRLLVLK